MPCLTAASVLEVDLGAVVANWRALSARHAGPVAGVLKANAYGLGTCQVAMALHSAGCRHFFVAHLQEALAIHALLPGAMLAVLNGLWPGDAATYAETGIAPVLGSLAEVDAYAAQARASGRPLPALLHVDTGMNRLGLPPAELDALAADPARLDGVRVLFVMTHLAAAELPDDSQNARQHAAFASACARLPPAPRSLSNSSGIWLQGFGSDLARPGAALYGVNPTPGQPNPMRPAIRLRARVLQVRDIPAGAGVGYNATWTALRPSRIATVPVGYADGYPRSLSNRAEACFDGAPVPLVGRVSMDLTTFDVTDLPGIQPGAWLDLIGPGMPVDEVAARAGTNAYEILTQLGPRYRRTYLPA
ncbi:MAG: alanine racemase [Janthinobacterium lividum]